MVYVYRETSKLWTGPHLLGDVDGKAAYVYLGERTGPRQFNTSQLKPSYTQHNENPNGSIANALTPFATRFTEVISNNDPRASQFDEAKRQEIMTLIDRGTFRLAVTEELPEKHNVVPSRYVLSIKKNGGTDVLKARLVLGGHRDRDRNQLVHRSTTLKQQGVRVLLAVAAIFSFDVIAADVVQAYLQSAEDLHRDVFVRSDCIALNPGELFRVIKPLYRLSDSGDYWDTMFADHHLVDLGMKQTTGDFSLFFKRIKGKVIGMSGSYVDDVIRAVTADFLRNTTEKTASRFDMKKPDRGSFELVGLETTAVSGVRNLSQRTYISRLKLLPHNATFTDHRSMRARLAWITHTRPDISCAISQAAQVTESDFTPNHVKYLNRVIKHLRGTIDITLKFPKLDINTIKLLVYTDASFANKFNLTSQLGDIMVLTDDSGSASIVNYQSTKSKRVTRSSMASETLAFSHGFDSAFFLRHDLERIVGRTIPRVMLTDSKALFDILIRKKSSTEPA
jgi:Reverse transcriptase (RNA-dependent DNA polymerase)